MTSILRQLLDERATYVSSTEFLAITLADMDYVGDDSKRPTASLIRGWLHRPSRVVQCPHCAGTGDANQRQRVPNGPGSLFWSAEDIAGELNRPLAHIEYALPDVSQEPWFQEARQWAIAVANRVPPDTVSAH